MLANNNRKFISGMAVGIIKRNKRRYGVLTVAVILSTFMVFTTLTVGETYFKMKRQQDLRTHGGDFNAVVGGGVLEKQKEVCEGLSDIESVGVATYSGYVTAAETDDTARAALIWCDKAHWEQQKRPVLEWVKGTYPRKENEIMADSDAMEKYGLGSLGIGDSFVLSYMDNRGEHTKEFYISGIFAEYSSGTSFYVSQAFYTTTGYQLAYDGMLYLKFKTPFLTEKTREVLEERLELEKRQRLIPTVETDKSIGVFVGMLGLIFFTCLSAYLLIYNILYLSASGNIRYYGLLQTVGMTEKQIRLFWRKQMGFIGTAGISGGLLSGAAVSFFILPGLVKALGIREKSIEISFHPLVLLLSIIVAGMTVCLGSRKAVKIAVEAEPVEALGYRTETTGSMSAGRRRGQGCGLLWRMAFRQIAKDKKKFIVVVLSLASALSVFLCMSTLIASHGPRMLTANYMDTDLEIRNDTLYKEEEEKWRQVMDDSFIRSLKNNKGVEELSLMLGAKIVVPWEPEFSDWWMREYYDTWMYYTPYDEVVEEYKQKPENFYSFIKGIDESEFAYINSTIETPVNQEQFKEGKICFLYQDNLSLDMDELKEKQVHYYIDGKKEITYQAQIAGLLEDGYYGGIHGYGPIVIVSNSYLKSIVEEPYVCKAAISYKEEFDVETEKRIMDSIEESPYAKDFSYDSKLENMNRIEKAQGNMRGVGLGITLILVIIGLLNYVNSVFANIQNRQTTLAVMESVGMTGKQMKGMLVREGLLLAAGALLITATAGTGVTYFCYQSMNYMDIPFTLPVMPVAAAAAASFLVCIAIPLLSYYILSGKDSLPERIRGFEQ